MITTTLCTLQDRTTATTNQILFFLIFFLSFDLEVKYNWRKFRNYSVFEKNIFFLDSVIYVSFINWTKYEQKNCYASNLKRRLERQKLKSKRNRDFRWLTFMETEERNIISFLYIDGNSWIEEWWCHKHIIAMMNWTMIRLLWHWTYFLLIEISIYWFSLISW